MLARRIQLLMLILAGGLCARSTAAEPFEEVIAEKVRAYTAPLREWLPLELQFAREVCELSNEQMAALRQAAIDEIELIAKNTAAALRMPPDAQDGRVVDVANMRKLVAVGLELQLANEITHSIVCRALEEKWPDAWQRFDAERQRLDERRRHAAVLAEVAALDERLWLTGRQRTELCDWMAEQRAEAWREAIVATVVDQWTVQLQTALAGGYLGDVTFPESALAKHLLPSQAVAFKDSQRPWREQAAAEDIALAQEVQRRQAAAPAAERIARALVVAKERERIMAQRKAQAAQQAAQPAAPRKAAVAPQKAAGSEQQIDEQRRNMKRYAERSIDILNTICDLTQEQHEKLLLAAKLDVEKLLERFLAESRPIEAWNEQLVVNGVRVFNDESSYFQKALRGNLLDDQKKKLAEAARERRAFQRRALIEAAVVGFERTAALTARQCEALSLILEETLGELDQASTNNWRATCARQVAQIGDARLAAVASNVQLPFVKRHQATMVEAATQFEEAGNRSGAKPVMGGGGMF